MSEDFTIAMTVAAGPEEAFDAITDVAGWWGRITGSTTALGDEFVYVVPGLHYSGFRVTEFARPHNTAWLVTGSYLDFVADKQEWNGSTVRFEVEAVEGGSRVTFVHEGLKPDEECYDICSNAWGMFVNGSLRSFIETGTGAPYKFDGDESLSAEDHTELHREAAAASRAADSK